MTIKATMHYPQTIPVKKPSKWGINTFLADESGPVIGQEWIDLIKFLKCDKVRVPIHAGPENMLILGPFIESAKVYKKNAIDVLAVLTMDTYAPWTKIGAHGPYPNAPLGMAGNKRQNPYISQFCARVSAIAQKLVPEGIKNYTLWNEPNLYAILPPGKNCPPAGEKPASLSPENFISLAYEAAGYLKEAGATDIHLGPLSWIGSQHTGTDPDNPYGARYLYKALTYLKSTGVKTLPFSHYTLNMELWWTEEEALLVQKTITNTFKISGYDPLPLVIEEWGIQNRYFNPEKAKETAAALAKISDTLYFEQGPFQTIGNPGGYGLHGWEVQGQNTFVPTPERSPWFTPYRAIVGAS